MHINLFEIHAVTNICTSTGIRHMFSQYNDTIVYYRSLQADSDRGLFGPADSVQVYLADSVQKTLYVNMNI